MSTFSFDVVSDFDRQELVNTLDQVRRDVAQRYDLKDSGTEIELMEVSLSSACGAVAHQLRAWRWRSARGSALRWHCWGEKRRSSCSLRTWRLRKLERQLGLAPRCCREQRGANNSPLR